MLSTALNTALSGLAAAQVGIGVSAHNIANALTEGFEPSQVEFREQSPAGEQPRQVGRGVLASVVDGPGDTAQASSSGTELADEIINLTLYSTMFRANLAVVETSGELMDELLQLRRS